MHSSRHQSDTSGTTCLSAPAVPLWSGLSWQQGVVIGYSGLRGAVGLALGLIVFEDLDGDEHKRIRENSVFLIAGIAFLTTTINGTTMRLVIDKLGLSRVSKASVVAFETKTLVWCTVEAIAVMCFPDSSPF